jgi:hypothetical protein
LERYSQHINGVIAVYQPSRSLSVFEGLRNVLPVDAYPSFEIEPVSAANEWATTRAQRPRYQFTCTLTTRTDNEKLHVEYITTIATVLSEIMTDPQNLQMLIMNETKWTPDGGLLPIYILDSLVEDATYSSTHDGTIRTAEFAWFALVHEPFPDGKFRIGDFLAPTILRPKVV